jgi:hypothetical protein
MEFEIQGNSTTRGVMIMTMLAVLLIVSAGSMVSLRAGAFIPGLKPGLSKDSSTGSVTQFAIGTASSTASNYVVPGIADPTIVASVSTFGSAGNHGITVASDTGVTPSSIIRETGKLNQILR